ncbi:MAG: hypothetical protein KAT90_06375 [Gammaproteobacteria bacterium]|nr:hypothetical protein [Gammaproteobacteria bacterium]
MTMYKKPEISDQALIRYLERVKGFDLDIFRKEILTKKRISEINGGCKELKIGKFRFKIRNKVIRTVVKSERQW